MNEDELRNILCNTRVVEIARGQECVVYTSESLPFVVKTVNGSQNKFLETLQGTELSISLLGGLIARTSIVHDLEFFIRGAETESRKEHIAIIQEKIIPVIKELDYFRSQNNFEETQRIFLEIAKIEKKCFARSVYPHDGRLDNIGVSSRSLVYFDFGHMFKFTNPNMIAATTLIFRGSCLYKNLDFAKYYEASESYLRATGLNFEQVNLKVLEEDVVTHERSILADFKKRPCYSESTPSPIEAFHQGKGEFYKIVIHVIEMQKYGDTFIKIAKQELEVNPRNGSAIKSQNFLN